MSEIIMSLYVNIVKHKYTLFYIMEGYTSLYQDNNSISDTVRFCREYRT